MASKPVEFWRYQTSPGTRVKRRARIRTWQCLRCISLGSVDTAARRFQNEPNTDTQASEHVDERVSTEQVDPTAKQVTHPRLGYPENFCRFGLREVSRRDQFLDLDHQVGSDE